MSFLTDNQFIKIIGPIITSNLITDGYSDVSLKQANQPTQQGINTNPTVYLYKVNSLPVGFRGRLDAWDSMSETMIHTEGQYMESTWQISAFVTQNPAITTLYTASDLVTEISYILQYESTITILSSNGIGIYKIGEIINPYFVNDQDQFYANPSFTFTVSYRNTKTNIIPIITQPVELDLYSV